MTQRSTREARAAAWAAYDKRMNEFMTKCDRNLPAEQTPEYKAAAAAIRPEGEQTPEYEFIAQLSTEGYQFHTEAADENRSLRYNNGKPDYSLIPLASMKEAAKVLEYGATKYARDNWKRPTHWSVSFACLQRHLAAWQDGEDNDPESGRNHLGHAMCNILQMLHMLENHPEELER